MLKSYEIFEKLLKENNITSYRVSKDTGISSATISAWKKELYEPKRDKLQKIADYFNKDIELFYSKPIAETYATIEENVSSKKIPKDLKKLLRDEEIALNGRVMNAEDKEKILKIIEAAFWEAKEMNKRK